MIAQLTGTLAHKSPQYIIIDVGGVGYRVFVSLSSFAMLPEIGNPLTILTHTHLREDQLTLFGFMTPEEKDIFQRLLAVSGVGPKIALTILSGIPAAELADAIAGEDALRLQSIPGVGKKTSERIIVELKDKLSRDYPRTETGTAPNASRRLYDDVLSALMNLGYQRGLAEKALKRVSWEDTTTIEAAIRATLKEIAKQ